MLYCFWHACVCCNCLPAGRERLHACGHQNRLGCKPTVLQVSYAAGLCALLLLWGVYPHTFDFGEATAVSREDQQF